MKNQRSFSASLTVATFFLMLNSPFLQAATTIDGSNKYAYGANIGWMDWSGGQGQTASGVVIGAYVCSGYIYAANVGWINLGSGSPTNGISYQNVSSNDFGVNQDGLGNLRGYAYGANIGWVNFENTGAPTIDMITGTMSGYVWSANCGWISLSNAVAYVQTDTISPGALDGSGSGLPIAWELTYFGTTNINPNADPDGDGMSNYEEYLAGTSPVNGSSYLHITQYGTSPTGTSATLTWTSVPTRFYYIQETLSLSPTNWIDNNVGLISPAPSPATTTTSSITDTAAPDRFYRIQALRPLTP
jgi:hypothetical protein